ncbi:hypothetical protein RIR_jg14107.t1 [Rhizophagus irregularis DAOM 181602=DAOM 197198]|nr:hypothetical protein RIR_jg14107.t1 [Rhizophagus irregularis DAOM 181602=DAOM 197198]
MEMSHEPKETNLDNSQNKNAIYHSRLISYSECLSSLCLGFSLLGLLSCLLRPLFFHFALFLHISLGLSLSV